MLRNLLLLVVASVVALAFAEGLLRFFPSLLTEEAALRMHWAELGAARDTEGQPMVVDDDDIGFRYLPHRTGELSRGDFSFTFTTDGHGFRNPWPWPDQADIVVVGDSMAFGYGVEDEAGWTSIVDRALPETSIVNLGMIGTGPPQYLEVLRRQGLGLHPDLVLFTLFPGNDLLDTAQFDGWRQSGADTGFRRWLARGDFDGGQADRLARITGDSYLIAVLRDVRRTLTSPFEGETLNLDDGRQLRLAPTAYVGSVELARPGHPVFERSMAVVEEARDLSLAQGADFVVVLVPTKEEVYLPPRGRPYPALVEAFAGALQARGIPHLDLTPALQEHGAASEKLYFLVDGHPNERGYAVIAEAVLAFLAERDAERDNAMNRLTSPKVD